jgi:hypothetical protein
MPNGTVPSGDSNYTFMLKHGIVYSDAGGFIGSGAYENGNRVNALRREGASYLNYWWGNDYVFGTYADENTITVEFDGNDRISYINNIFVSQSPSSGRNSDSINNTIGVTYFNEYLIGYLYYVFIFNKYTRRRPNHHFYRRNGVVTNI